MLCVSLFQERRAQQADQDLPPGRQVRLLGPPHVHFSGRAHLALSAPSTGGVQCHTGPDAHPPFVPLPAG